MADDTYFKKRVTELGLGHSVNLITVWGFDYVLYPLVIFWLGLAWGFVVMAMLSFLVCWLTMKFYDWSRRDWLGIEAIKDLKVYDGPSRARRWLAWVLRRTDFVACILLSIKFDPFIVTTYLRRGHYGAMDARDWRIFLLSWLIGNAWWSLLCYAGVESIVGLWHWIRMSSIPS